MYRRTSIEPGVERLELLSLLSGGAAALVHHPHAEVSTDGTIALSGTEHGLFYARRNSAGTTYSLFATARLAPVGLQTTNGALRVLSGISSGPPSGTLHIVAARGTLKLRIPQSVVLPVGLPAPTSPQNIVETYVITKGTRAYRGDTGSGVVEFTFDTALSVTSRYQVGLVDVTFSTLTS
jgi:hypothetical protein